jgi:tetratricopeptide (TPR) repeat protein
MPFPYIYTFYSYKGGVGRSLALLNVAYTLAGRGRHVLMIDMDLEAPGISGFLRRHDEVEIPQSPLEPGVLTLLEAAIQNLPGTDEGLSEATAALPPLRDLLWSVRAERLEALKPKLGLLGRLDVLGAELSEGYFQRLENLGLKNLDYDGIVRLSKLLRIYFKAHRFPHRPLGVEDFEEPTQTPYDYILIDSRTGVTEIGGLCVGPLADRLVVLTGLNDQNLEGTATLLKEIGVELRPRRAGDPAWDEADPISADIGGATALGPKPTVLVATPVPVGETELKRERKAVLESRLGAEPMMLSYFPRLALIETLIVRDFAEESLADEYYRLTTRVMAEVRDDAQSLARRYNSVTEPITDVVEGAAVGFRLAPVDSALGEFWLIQMGIHALQRSDHLLVRRVSAHLATVPSRRAASLIVWGDALVAQAQDFGGRHAALRFELACQKYEESIRIDPSQNRAQLNSGIALVFLSSYAENPDREGELLERAHERLLSANRGEPGSATFLLACLSALRSNAPEALRWLEDARHHKEQLGSVSQARLAAEPCFDRIRSDPEFIRFVESLPPE